MILKSYIVEQDIKVLEGYRATLLYGENLGIKDDVKSKLKHLNKDAEILIFFEEEILKNKNILYENVINESLFSNKKIIFILEASDKIFNEIHEAIEKDKKTKIYIFANNLDKKTKLRNLFEKDNQLAIFACYEDNDQTLIKYISKELKGYAGLTGELINFIIKNSNMNRKIIQNELIKIKNFFKDKKLNIRLLEDLMNIKNNADFEKIRDAVLIGEKNKINRLLSEIELANEESFFYLSSLNYRISKLLELHKKLQGSNNYEETVNNLKPPVFWKDRPIYIQQLKKWSLTKLEKAAYQISDTEILMKKNSHINNNVLIKNLLIAICNQISTSS